MFGLLQLYAYCSTETLIGVCVSSALFILVFWRKLFEWHKYPPGPMPLPVIGSDYHMFFDSRAEYRYSELLIYSSFILFQLSPFYLRCLCSCWQTGYCFKVTDSFFIWLRAIVMNYGLNFWHIY